MLTIYPRARSVIIPTLLSYQLAVYEDDEQIDILLDNIFKIRRNVMYGSPEYHEYRKEMLNQPYSLQQGLPLAAMYIVDDPEPVLLLSLHHAICDGMGTSHFVNSLLAFLNDKTPPFIPLDKPDLLPALLKKPYYRAPLEVYRSYKIVKNDAQKYLGRKVVNVSKRPVDYFSPTDAYQQFLSTSLTAVISKSKELGCRFTDLLFTALTLSFCPEPAGDKEDIAIFLPFDMRRFFNGTPPVFGNYTQAPIIRVPTNYKDDPKKMFTAVQKQIVQFKNQFDQKQLVYPYLIHKMLMLVGKKNYARGMKAVRKRGIGLWTGSFSNFGNLEHLNSHGEKAQVSQCITAIPHYGLFVTMSCIDNRLNTCFSYPVAEFSQNEIKNITHSFDSELGRLMTM